MKLASYRLNDRESFGVAATDGSLIDIPKAAGGDAPASLLELITMGEAGLTVAREAADQAPADATVSVNDIHWLPPVVNPGKICGIAMNNSASNERKISAPEHPAFFLKPSSCLLGHQNTVEIRSYYGSVHPEPELAAVIGRSTRDVSAEEALASVFGYSIFDDITGNGMRAEDLFRYYALYAANDNEGTLERREQHLSYAGRYKGTDNFGVLGPWLVTSDAVREPDDLSVTCKIGGEIIADDSTRYYNYKVAELVSFISQFQTLYPGDIVSCGTAFKPSARRKSIHHADLQKVDGPIEITIEGLGTQISPVRRVECEIGAWRFS